MRKASTAAAKDREMAAAAKCGPNVEMKETRAGVAKCASSATMKIGAVTAAIAVTEIQKIEAANASLAETAIFVPTGILKAIGTVADSSSKMSGTTVGRSR